MEAGLREVCRSVRIGKILIQRVSRVPSLKTLTRSGSAAHLTHSDFCYLQDEETAQAKLFYAKVAIDIPIIANNLHGLFAGYGIY